MEKIQKLLVQLQDVSEFSKTWESEIIIILIVIIFILILINRSRLRRMQNIIENLPGLRSNTSLITKVTEHEQKLFNSEIFTKATEENFKKINQKLKKIYRSETVRYNPYQDMGVGGNQSFSTTFINTLGDGIILTSLYARDRTRLLLKEIKHYECEQELTPEEKEVLKKFKS